MRHRHSELNRSSKHTYLNKSLFWRVTLMSICLFTFVAAVQIMTLNDWKSNAASSRDDRKSPDGLWQEIDDAALQQRQLQRPIVPEIYRTFSLNLEAMRSLLRTAPMEFSDEARNREVIMTLPMPDGTFARFRIVQSPVVEAGLAANFPGLDQTFSAQGIDDPTMVMRFDLLPSGFHAMVLSTGDTIFVDPYATGDMTHYISYYKKDVRRVGPAFECDFINPEGDIVVDTHKLKGEPEVINGSMLRTYRLALAATNEYAVAVGGNTVAGTLAAQVLVMNRVNGVYERDVAIHMNIIANNNLIVYAADRPGGCGGVCTGANDPYTNNDGGTMLGQNQATVDAVIGTANYDIGHVFSTGGGGIATLNSPCNAATKARGVTGLGNPVGDPFAIDYVAHEMGHQYGGNHTFNGTTGSCGGGNRAAGAAVEPGSGITIQAYAGICGAQDLAAHSIDTFSVKSLEEIVAFREGGGTCGPATATGNTPPSVSGPGNFTIPKGTPFALTATGSDVNGDTLSFSWEEYDLGAASPPDTDADGMARPIFRPYLPTAGGTRLFPSLTYILNNADVPPTTTGGFLTGEILPSIARTMTFQVVARDNRAGGGGINTATSTLTVNGASGPFNVSAPNTAVVWTTGSMQTVTWNVAGTSGAPVSCANVKISLSTDGGNTFPTVLNASTGNDGTEMITVPNLPSTTARVKVEALGNIFFDISDTNFIVNRPPVITCPANITTSTDAGMCSAVVTFTATAMDTDPVTKACTPPSGTAFPKGTTTVQCVATDSQGATDTCSFTITVNDTENPVIACPANITVGNDPGLCSATVNPGTATATDNCPGVTVNGTRNDGQPLNAPYPVGTTLILWKATDTSNNMASCTQTIVVNDVEAPVITASVEESCLWPPNHDLTNVGLSLAVSDNCTAASAIAVTVKVTSDERPEIGTKGDGNFSPDARVTGTGVNRLVRIRRERMGGGDGRVYLIRITATDQYNNTSLKVLRVDVPSDQSLEVGPSSAPCAVDSRPVPGSDAPDGGFFAESPPAPVIGKKQ